MLEPITDVDAFVTARTAWHTLAERVLAPARHAATGRIGLRVLPDGITTPPFGDDGRSVAVRGADLWDARGGAGHAAPLSTLGAAAASVGVPLDVDTGVYTPTTPSDPATPVVADSRAVSVLTRWFVFGDRVLRAWAGAHPDETPSEVQLWPEHFDLGTDLGPDDAGRANYGASPGDDGHTLPYLYVGPWVASDDPFWDAGSYARLPYETLAALDDPERAAAEFFRRGHEIATRSKS